MPDPDSDADAARSGPPLPGWADELRSGVATMRVEHITRFSPPAGTVPREGAVLVLFGEGRHGPDLLLTERAHTMRTQPGQVSFPGGALDGGEDAVRGALREAEEETGLDPAGVEVLAVLPRLYLPPSNFAVAPVLGYWRRETRVRVVDPAEVHEVYRVPVAHLLDPDRRFTVRHPMGWAGPGWAIGPGGEVLLWGFTAGIIDALFDHVGWTRDWDRSRARRLPDSMIDWRRIAEAMGIEVPEDGRIDPVQAGLVMEDYLDLDRHPEPPGRRGRTRADGPGSQRVTPTVGDET